MNKRSIYEEYAEKICRICKNKLNCQEELRKREGNLIKCYEYKRIKEGE